MLRSLSMVFFVLGLTLTAPATSQDIRVDLELGPGSSIGVDQMATLTIRIHGADRRIQPEADFELENLRIASGPSTAKSLRFQDGASSHSLTMTWHLRPLGLGSARVHSARVRIGVLELSLPDDQLKIVETRPPQERQANLGRDPFEPQDALSGDPLDNAPSGSPLGGDPFGQRRRRARPAAPPKIYLSAEVEPQNPYVGQQLLCTLYLYTQVDVRSVNPEELPDFKGFWSRVVPQPDQLRPKMIHRDGERVGKVILLQRALFPRRAGRFVIEPVQARLAALMPDSGPFGSLLPRTRDILRSSDPVTIDVRELPPAPTGFQGAVGQIEVTAELSPTELDVGSAATLTLSLTGQGHFQGLPAPQLAELDGIRIFPPQQQSRESVERKSVSGERTWSFVLVPERPGTWQLPAIEVPYFDPARERYLTASAETPALEVRGSVRLPQNDGPALQLHPIRASALPVSAVDGRSRLQLWLFALPWLLTAAILVARRRGDGHQPQRQQLLESLQAAARNRQPRQAAAEIEEAWRNFLHHRWNLPPGAPSTQWSTLLAARGARPTAASELVKLADDLHYLRYAPKLSSTEELQRELVDRSRKLIRGLG